MFAVRNKETGYFVTGNNVSYGVTNNGNSWNPVTTPKLYKNMQIARRTKTLAEYSGDKYEIVPVSLVFGEPIE